MDHVVSVACASCGTVAQDGSKFCEQCGSPLPALVAVGVLVTEPVAEPAAEPVVRACRACGGTIADDGYCQDCGTPAATERDHWAEALSPTLGGVCDRGIRHDKNEDAMALGLAAGAAVLVVCDGVSSVPDSDIASLAAARAARDVLVQGIADGASDTARVAAWSALLVRAAGAANDAIAGAVGDMSGRHDPPSCTFVAAVVDGPLVVAGWLGDSRVYWLPDAGDPIQLSSDDSGANDLMALGVPRAKAESSPQAHAITRWLGADAHDVVPRTAPTRAQGSGWVLVCSDGLWNYCSEATAMADLLRRSQQVSGNAPEAISAEPCAGRTSRAAPTTSPLLCTGSRSCTPRPRSILSTADGPVSDRLRQGATVAEFRTEVFQNEFLSEGATDVHAIVTVTSSGAGTAGAASATGTVAEIVMVDTSGSMQGPNIDAAKYAAQVAVDQIADGTWFAIIGGSHVAQRAFPYPNAPVAIVQMEPGARREAKRAISLMSPSGGTAMSTWLRLADQVFARAAGDAAARDPAHGRPQRVGTPRRALERDPGRHRALPVRRPWGRCQVGGGRAARDRVGTARHGRPDRQPGRYRGGLPPAVAASMSKGVADAELRVWAPQGAQVLFVRRVAPSVEDLTGRRTEVNALTGAYPTATVTRR